MQRMRILQLFGVTLASSAPLLAQILPGSPRAFQLTSAPPASVTLDRVMPGEFDGDHRGDLALLVAGELRVVYAAAGYGVSLAFAAPGGGAFVDVAVVPGSVVGRHRLFALLKGGTAAGLYEVQFPPAAAPTLRWIDDDGFAAVDALGAHSGPAATRIFGIQRGAGLVHRLDVLAEDFVLQQPVSIPSGVKRFRVAAVDGDASNPQLILEQSGQIVVYTQAGAAMGEIQLTAGEELVDFDAGFNAAVGDGRVMSVVRFTDGLSECRVHQPTTSQTHWNSVQTIELGAAAPRIVLEDLLDRGELDIVAVTTNGSVGFASFGGLAAAPGTYNFTPSGTVLFGFNSPNFWSLTAHSNVATFDFDYDGDRDVAFCDHSMNTVWVQPSWINNEITGAPATTAIESLYTYQRPGAQDFRFAFTPPVGSFVPTHMELNVYHKKVIAGVTQHLLAAHAFLPATESETYPGAYGTGTITVIAEYDGAQGTDADFVIAIRFFAAQQNATTWQSIGIEAFTEFHHSRTPHPNYPGTYLSGSPGGVNPLPVVIGNGIVAPGTLPPAPPPPPGT